MNSRPERYTLYNYAPPSPHRGSSVVGRETEALLDDYPVILGGNEAIGYTFPKVKGYTLIRDRSRPGRANVIAYVQSGRLESFRWHDMTSRWPKTDHPGMHAARSWLEIRLTTGEQVFVGHQPPWLPPKIPNRELIVAAGQKEGIDLLTKRMAPWLRDDWAALPDGARAHSKDRVRIALADWNRGPREDGPGPARLANTIGGWVVGSKIDAAVVRGATGRDARYITEANGVKLGSDHHHALTFQVVK